MSLTREKAQLMSASEIDRTLVRLAHEILEKTNDLDRLAFIGIRRRGVPLAQRLSKKIGTLETRNVPVGILDINLYRDDLSTVDIKPVVSSTEIQGAGRNCGVIHWQAFAAPQTKARSAAASAIRSHS